MFALAFLFFSFTRLPQIGATSMPMLRLDCVSYLARYDTRGRERRIVRSIFFLSAEPIKLIHLRRFSSDRHTVTVYSPVPYRFVGAYRWLTYGRGGLRNVAVTPSRLQGGTSC